MQITPAGINDVATIAKKLADYYASLNNEIGFDLYTKDINTLTGHVAKRIENAENNFFYFVANDGTNGGFINAMFEKEKERGQILIVLADNEDILQSLLVYALDHLKSLGAKAILAEESTSTSTYSLFEKAGFKEYGRNLISIT